MSDTTTTTPLTAPPRTWCYYVERDAGANFDIARRQQIWGASKLSKLERISAGDHVLFVHNIPPKPGPTVPGYPRLKLPAFRQAIGHASLILRVVVTTDIFTDHTEVWPDGSFPYRFKFQELAEEADVDLLVAFSDEALDVIRQAVITLQARELPSNAWGYLFDPTVTPSAPDRTPDTTADIDDHEKEDDVIIDPADETDILSSPATSTFGDAPLAPLPEPLLKQRIAALRRHILCDESLIRRIYHALLVGHVILSGPPGTGKTELARLIPELLWRRSEDSTTVEDAAYTTTLVTATDEWSVRTLIGGLAPVSVGEQVHYRFQYGHLTRTILDNWDAESDKPTSWRGARRIGSVAHGALNTEVQQPFRGRWLVIDEFNRAPIDLALGEALTALGGSGILRVPVNGGSNLHLPRDFRIIGTLNSFDRNYLNQISEALKRRFAFIEVPPPTRTQREDEQAIALAKALHSIAHLSDDIEVAADGEIRWGDAVTLAPSETGSYTLSWGANSRNLKVAVTLAWEVFEVVRIYRQLGTAQAIALLRQTLVPLAVGAAQDRQAVVAAVDQALCDTVADQLQLLLPDELEALLLSLTVDAVTLEDRLNKLLARLVDNERRLLAQCIALNSIVDEKGDPIAQLPQETAEIDGRTPPALTLDQVRTIFHATGTRHPLKLFTNRLRTFGLERGL